jgi:hypothetical protein
MYLAGRTFDPELTQSMSIAFQGVCDGLGLKPIDDAVTRLVAEKIINLAESGVHSSAALNLLTFREFKPTHASQAANSLPQPTLADGSELIEPIPCDRNALAISLALQAVTTPDRRPEHFSARRAGIEWFGEIGPLSNLICDRAKGGQRGIVLTVSRFSPSRAWLRRAPSGP